MGLRFFSLPLLLSAFALLSSCSSKKSKSDIEIAFTQDTLQVGYTYWWEESGPFIGYCGEEYALVFTGTVVDLKAPTNEAAPLYIAQKGTIELEKVLKINNPDTKSYANQKFFASDCFNGLELSLGDKVLVFCYTYEGDFTIPGKRSILKINGFDHPLVKAAKTYIDADQNPTKIKKDTTLWSAYGFGNELAQHIRCRENSE
jgi:hypothetical protein